MEKKYKIYHIPGVKIGVSVVPNQRVKMQGYTNYEILETHTDKKLASVREHFLQKKYGYKVDKILYYKNQGFIRKLTYEEAQYVRKQYKRKYDVNGKKITQRRLGNIFGVDHMVICKILNNKTYTQE